MRSLIRLCVALLASAAHGGALAQIAAQQAASSSAEKPVEPVDLALQEALPPLDSLGTIVVIGRRLRGQVIGDIPPEVQLDEQEVQSRGAGSIGELLDSLEPLTRSGGGREGRPVTLLNGLRISGLSEIRDIPSEAIERVDILRGEVALKYGYRADQRVVNFVLKESFSALTTQMEGGMTTGGGRGRYESKANIFQIAGGTRWILDGRYQHQTPLLESERDIVQTAAKPRLDLGNYRSLLAETDQFSVNGAMSRTVLGDVGATLNGTLETNRSRSLIGLAPTREERPLARITDGTTVQAAGALSGSLPTWRWSLTGNFARIGGQTIIETGEADSVVRSIAQIAVIELAANGPLFALPAGDVSASFRIGAAHQGLKDKMLRSPVQQEKELSRGRGNLQVNVDVPIARREPDVRGGLGDISINFNGEIDHLSDFGTLRALGAGISWSPVRQVRLLASITDEDGAPSMQQLGDPVLASPSLPVFDFLRRQTTDVTRIEGGNPDLLAYNRRVFKLGLTLRPFEKSDIIFRGDYNDSRTENLIAPLPAPTPEIEAAFPDRLLRDEEGRLLRIDSRPVNFARSDREELRWGLSYTTRLGGEQPRRGGFGARGEGTGGRLQFGLFHSWRFEDSLIVRDGVKELDLLNGAAIGSRGGQPRHRIEFQGGISNKAYGARLTIDWQAGTFIEGGSDGRGGAAPDLFFSDHAAANLRIFANLGQQQSLVRAVPLLGDTRVTLAIENPFNTRLKVHDEKGTTPLGYQKDYLDPAGRSIEIGIRKQF